MIGTKRSTSWPPWRSALALVAMTLLAGCDAGQTYPNRPITLVCPWAVGGGTDRVSRQMAAHLEVALGVPVNVINAVGGKGVTGHRRGLSARPDGYTLTTITLELNTLRHSGLTQLSYEDCTPLMSVNEDYAALFVRDDAPWRSLAELKAEVRQQPGKLTASGTARGAAWHLALAGWLIATRSKPTDINWISSTGAAPSLQELLSGGLDMVCCSLPEARTLYRAGRLRCLGVMAPERALGYPDIPTFQEQGDDWTLCGWRGLALPKGAPQEVVDTLVPAIRRVVTGQTKVAGRTFPEFMQIEAFNATWRTPDDFRKLMAENDAKFAALLSNPLMKATQRDRFGRYRFPELLLGVCVVVLVVLWVQRRRARRAAGIDTAIEPATEIAHGLAVSRSGLGRFLLILAAASVYLFLVETIGFVLAAGATLVLMLVGMGVRLPKAVLIAAVFVPLVYQLFAGLLRVPLARGWLGW